MFKLTSHFVFDKLLLFEIDDEVLRKFEIRR